MKLTAWEYRDTYLCPECTHNSKDSTRCLHLDQAQLEICVWEALRMMHGGEQPLVNGDSRIVEIEKRVERLERDLKDIVNGLRNIGQIW